MYMQINTSSEKIHKLISPLKFEVLDVARKTINADTPTIFYTKERIVLFIYVTTIYLDFLHLCFSERRNLIPRLFLRGRKDPGRSWSRGKSIILHASTSALNTSIARGDSTSKYLLNLTSVCSYSKL
jgi:hypothetical protein